MSSAPRREESEYIQQGQDATKAINAMVVAGESSSDQHAASFVRGLKELSPNSSVFGMGGQFMRSAGAETVIDSEEVASVMGLTEVVASLGGLIGALRSLIAEAQKRKPDVVVLVDFPDFNLLLAKALKKRGFKILYFVSPQLWAWRKGRVKTMQKYIDEIAVIFPFEEDFYKDHGVKAHYVGHPFLKRDEVEGSRDEFFVSNELDPSKFTFALLPGSRKAEIERLLAPMVEGFSILQKKHQGLQAVIPLANTLDRNDLQPYLEGVNNVFLIDGQCREVMKHSDCGVVASGTATIEAALEGLAFFVVYRLSNLTYKIARLLVRGVKNFAMVNLVADRKVVEELLQDEVTADNIAKQLEKMLLEDAYRAKIKDDLKLVRVNLERNMSIPQVPDGVSQEGVAIDPGKNAAKLALDLVRV
jgi:lipid-A-disaccharide synthase